MKDQLNLTLKNYAQFYLLYLSDENCDERMTPNHLMCGRNMHRRSIVDNNDAIITWAWNAILAKSWELFSWRTVEILLRRVRVFIMKNLRSIFYYERPRFSSWQLEIFIIKGPDFNSLLLRKNSGTRGKHLPIELLWTTVWLLVTRVSLIYVANEFFSLFLVYLNKMRTLSESKVISFCS